MTKIIFEFPQGIEEFEFETKTQIQYDDELQSALVEAKKTATPVKCLCREGVDNALLTIHISQCKTHQRLRRNHHYLHDKSCLFYINTRDFYNDETGHYGEGILKEPQPLYGKHQRYELDAEREIARRVTYRQFCIDVFSEAIAYAFNKTNQFRKKNDLVSYTLISYFSCLHAIISDTKLTNGKNAFESLPKNSSLSVGIIQESLGEVKNHMLTLQEYDHSSKQLREQMVGISDNRLEITKKLQKIYGNILDGPYAYIAVYKIVDGENRIVRLYTYAIAQFDDKFCFVESKLERNHACRLFEKNIVFTKPVAKADYQNIANRYFPSGRPSLRFRPDFIIFTRKGIVIIEVCGFSNKKRYMAELRRKEAHYKTLLGKGLFRYQRVGCTEKVSF